ncbi:helix-turn-helix domain-containing protein [Paraburkholderia sp. RL18-103-BIB-C]
MLDDGRTQSEIAAELGVMRTTVTRWLNAHSERKQALADSRAHAAHGLAEGLVAIADDAANAGSAHEVQAAKLRIETRRWLAGVWNRAEYGERQAGVVVNIGTLHLDALRQAQAGLPVPVEVLAHEPAARPLGELIDVAAVPVVVPVERAGDHPIGDAFGLM